MRVLAFDPGTNSTGWSLFQDKKPIQCGKFRASSGWVQSKRLGYMLKMCNDLIKKAKPDVIIVEQQFAGKNAKTSLITARAMGIIISLAGMYGIKTVAYQPSEVKKAVTGKGNDGKEVVAEKLLEIYSDDVVIIDIGNFVDKGKDKTDDIYDAVAINHTYWQLGEEVIEIKKKQETVVSRVI